VPIAGFDQRLRHTEDISREPTTTLASVDSDAGRLRHYRDFYRPATTPRHQTRPLWLVWGNCQAEAVRRVLDAVPDRPYRTARVPPVHELRAADMSCLNTLLGQTAVLLTQPVRTGYRDLPIGVADLMKRLPAGATVLRWPVIRDHGLYPFQAITRHPADRSVTPPVVPYHDLRTVAAARDGCALGDPWDVDVTAAQIRAVAAASIDHLAFRERRDTDIGISDRVRAHGADAAHTINHPGNPVLHDLARRLLDANGTSSPLIRIAGPLLDSTWAPLDERVTRALGIPAPPRAQWRHHDVEIDPQDVHATQLAWYRRNPDFVGLTLRRHRATMRILGLTGGAS
jgi:hypothetical protein